MSIKLVLLNKNWNWKKKLKLELKKIRYKNPFIGGCRAGLLRISVTADNVHELKLFAFAFINADINCGCSGRDTT